MATLSPEQLKEKYHIYAKDSGTPATQDTATRLAQAVENGGGGAGGTVKAVETVPHSGVFVIKNTGTDAGATGIMNGELTDIDSDVLLVGTNGQAGSGILIKSKVGNASSEVDISHTGAMLTSGVASLKVQPSGILGVVSDDATVQFTADHGAIGIGADGVTITGDTDIDVTASTLNVSHNNGTKAFDLAIPSDALPQGRYVVSVDGTGNGTLLNDATNYTATVTVAPFTINFWRNGNVVVANITATAPASGTTPVPLTIPTGFKPTSYGTSVTNVMTAWSPSPFTWTPTTISSNGANPGIITINPQTTGRMSNTLVTWITDEPLPTA